MASLRSDGTALAPAITLNRMYHWVPSAMSSTLPKFRLSPMSRNTTMANGKMKFAGKLASTCTTGCMYWATRGLKPIHTPTGTQTTEDTATTTATRSSVEAHAERVPDHPEALLPGGDIGQHVIQAVAERGGDGRGERHVAGPAPRGVADQAPVVDAGGRGHELVHRPGHGPPAPRGQGRPARPAQDVQHE